MKSFQAAILDFDGVIVETEEALILGVASADCCAELLGYNVRQFSPRHVDTLVCPQNGYVGENSKAFARLRYPDTHHLGLNGYNSVEVQAATEWIYEECFQRSVQPVRGIEESLKVFHEHGFPVAILSNAPLHRIHERLKTTGLKKYFEPSLIFGGDAVQKPSQESYIRVAKALETDPRRIAMFDDMGKNVDGATRAGMQGVYANYSIGRRGKEDEKTPEARRMRPKLAHETIESALEIPNFLGL